MGMFIELRIDPVACQVASGCDLCARLCPVEAFRVEGGWVTPVYDNEDECTLCNLCVEQCPGRAIEVIKLY
jgi:NAD-dependent dihydropyrimidine dehydrogenase PreA subunit